MVSYGEKGMGTLEENLFYQLGFICAESRQVFIQRLGMSQARYHLLALLAEKGEIRHAALQQYLVLDGPMITRLVKQFEQEGLVSRRLDPQDNRYTLAALTDAGRQVIAEIGEAHRVFVTQLLDGISNEEQEAMLRVLKHVHANILLAQQENRVQG